jgi:hypothetical protein
VPQNKPYRLALHVTPPTVVVIRYPNGRPTPTLT